MLTLPSRPQESSYSSDDLTMDNHRRPRPDRPMLAPRQAPLRDVHLFGALAGFVACVLGLWVRNGGWGNMFAGDGTALWTGITQLSGLLCVVAGLVGLLLASRLQAIERLFGLDRLLVWHRYLGEMMAVLVGVHAAAGVVSWKAVAGGWWGSIRDSIGGQPYMAWATAGGVIVGIVTITSLRSMRQRFSYETWYFIHLTAYLGLALSFSHEIVLGTDFADDTLTRWFWIGVHVLVAGALIVGRWGQLALSLLNPLKVRQITQISHDTVEVELAGTALARRRGAAGQFVIVRTLTPELWWKSNPFSLSSAPTSRSLRLTVKHRGDGTAALHGLALGTKVAVEGPYGTLEPSALAGAPAVFIVGGVGVAPVRALLQAMPRGSTNPIVLYRARQQADLVHIDEIRALAARHGGEVLTLLGPTAALANRDPFSASSLKRAIPDIASRVAVVCGPDSLVHAARSGLRAAGVPNANVHFERSWW